jgi:LacI family transcriptional regulator
LSKRAGKVGTIVDSHRYRCQDLNEIGFRSFFREHAPEFTILEAVTSLEDDPYAAEITRDLRTARRISSAFTSPGAVSSE